MKRGEGGVWTLERQISRFWNLERESERVVACRNWEELL